MVQQIWALEHLLQVGVALLVEEDKELAVVLLVEAQPVLEAAQAVVQEVMAVLEALEVHREAVQVANKAEPGVKVQALVAQEATASLYQLKTPLQVQSASLSSQLSPQ